MVWQYFVRNWLRQEAGKRVQQAVAAAGADATSTADQKVEPAVCHVGIVVNEPSETGSILDRLSGVIKTHGHGFKAYEGGLRGRRIIVVEAGADGPAAATAATRSLLDGHHPRWVIAAGFAGGLVSELDRGDLIVASSVADTSGRRLSMDVKSPSEVERGEFHVGRVVSVKQQPRHPDAKRDLAARFDAVAVDTSSMGIADACCQANVLCLVVRVIRDAVDDQLPSEVRNLLDQESIAGKLGAATGGLMKRPSSVKDWWNIKEETLKSADRLASFLDELIKQLIPSSSLRSESGD